MATKYSPAPSQLQLVGALRRELRQGGQAGLHRVLVSDGGFGLCSRELFCIVWALMRLGRVGVKICSCVKSLASFITRLEHVVPEFTRSLWHGAYSILSRTLHPR